ncbi:hypothetical protein QVD17_39776 [Tagetes erecta]|uniref:Uncharacterized protein n=1 Tax=Tagetes erecta TaxID=13708 RepID=A0AAD8JP55_TARER|nr:hypothetical protein QVD17_39776 [Tagetes erecta]
MHKVTCSLENTSKFHAVSRGLNPFSFIRPSFSFTDFKQTLQTFHFSTLSLTFRFTFFHTHLLLSTTVMFSGVIYRLNLCYQVTAFLFFAVNDHLRRLKVYLFHFS